jgi:maltose alpha-D-glucosyltransferase/alpha-amylase
MSMRAEMASSPEWLDQAIFYEIYPPSFFDANGDGIGDIPGMTAKLDYLAESGFNAIWLNPWFESSFRDGGYDVTDFYKIAPRYGTNADAARFFEEAHQRGMHVIIDLVIGHTALEHPWFLKSGEVEPNEFSDLFIWCPQLAYRGDAENYYVSGFAPRGAYRANFFAIQPAINYGFNQIEHPWEMPFDHPSCVKNRELMKDLMRFWLDLGCDGFRVDMAASVIKRDPGFELTSKFWREVRMMFDQEYPEAILVSEWFMPEYSLPAGFHLDFALPMGLIRNDNWSVDPPQYGEVIFSRHKQGDLAQWVRNYTELIAKVDPGGICFFSGSHDQWRLSHYGDQRDTAVKFALILTLPGCPFVYYGDEIGMRYLPQLNREGSSTRGGSRSPMQWTKTENLGFSTAPPEKLYLPVDPAEDAPTVEEALRGDNPLYNTVRRLIALRRAHPALQSNGNLRFLHGQAGEFPLVYERENLLVVLNPLDKVCACKLPKHNYKSLFASGVSMTADGQVRANPISFGLFLCWQSLLERDRYLRGVRSALPTVSRRLRADHGQRHP